MIILHKVCDDKPPDNEFAGQRPDTAPKSAAMSGALVVGLNHVSNVRLLMNPLLSSYSPNGYAVGDAAGLSMVGSRAGCINGM